MTSRIMVHKSSMMLFHTTYVLCLSVVLASHASLLGEKNEGMTAVVSSRRSLAEVQDQRQFYSIWWRFEATLALVDVPSLYAARVLEISERHLGGKAAFSKLRASPFGDTACKDVKVHVIQIQDRGDVNIYPSGIWECQRRLFGAHASTVDRMAAGKRLTLIGAINEGWDPLLNAIYEDLAVEGGKMGAKLAQIPRIMEAGLDAKVVLLKSGDSIATWDGEDIKQLNSAVIEELARSHSQKQLQDTGLSLWEIASVAIPCILVAFVAITVVCFIQERKRVKAARIPAALPSPVANAWTFNSPGIGIQSREGLSCQETTTEMMTSAIEVNSSATRSLWKSTGRTLRRILRALFPPVVGTVHERVIGPPGHVVGRPMTGLDDPIPCYQYEQLSKACSGFSRAAHLGSGGFGDVYAGCLNHTPIAVKVLKSGGTQGGREFLAELEVLSRISHPNIVMLLGCCRDVGRQCLVYEWMANGSLEDRLSRASHDMPPLLWSVRLSIALDVTRALCFLHGHPSQEITHHDVKPANILLDDRFMAKVSDVGLARVAPALVSAPKATQCLDQAESDPATKGSEGCEEPVCLDSGVAAGRAAVPSNESQIARARKQCKDIDTFCVGTLDYMDPEYLATGRFHPSCDIYALGVTMMQLITALPAEGLPAVVEAAVSTGKSSDLCDPRAGRWPPLAADALFQLSLLCTRDRALRPSLDRIMAELEMIACSQK